MRVNGRILVLSIDIRYYSAVQVSRKAEYAVRAALDLALHTEPGGGARSSEIARRTGVPKKFLEAILLDLRKAGFVSSKRGPDGGHWLARNPSGIPVAAILQAIDGPLAAGRTKARHRSSAADLSLHAFWDEVETAVRSIVDTVTVDDLRRQADTRGALDFNI
jgi:Rrf2 family protein